MPVPLERAGDQMPPGSGVPPKLSKRSCEAPLLHNIKEPLVPGLGASIIKILTVMRDHLPNLIREIKKVI